MNKRTIKKNRHRPTPLRIAALHPIFIFNKKHFEKRFSLNVRFNSSCKYLIDIDQSDWNKLTGVCLGAAGPHGTSYRFGWRWREDIRVIEICAYYYCNGIGWNAEHLAYLNLNMGYDLSLRLKARDGRIVVMFTAKEIATGKYYQHTIHHVLEKSPRLGFGCGLYFGGNRKAPHNIEVYMSDITVSDV